MFTHITIDQFMLVEHLELELANGMTAITGETGTGKSLLLDALSLALGAKAQGDCVRAGADKATITATFIPTTNAQQWLAEHELNDGHECIIRRTLTKEGRSRCYVNGQVVSLCDVRTLGEMLIDIHSQHAHQSLLKKDHQRRLLDDYGDHRILTEKVSQHYQHWQTQAQQLAERQHLSDELTARHQLLRYQVEELDQLELTTERLTALEQEQVMLSNAELLITQGNQLHTLCDDDTHGLLTQLHQAKQLVKMLQTHTARLNNTKQMLEQATIHIEEAEQDISHFLADVELDPERLSDVEQTLSVIYDTARKHRVEPEALPALHAALTDELARLSGSGQSIETLAAEAEAAKQHYFTQANKLSNKRAKLAKQLSHRVNQLLQDLSMKDAVFVIAVDSDDRHANRHGIDAIELLISTNKGHKPKSLHKVASGGGVVSY
ncbi:DNA repair protein RecN [bacterium]|nr:DNA repair protein RecN [bacterium]